MDPGNTYLAGYVNPNAAAEGGDGDAVEVPRGGFNMHIRNHMKLALLNTQESLKRKRRDLAESDPNGSTRLCNRVSKMIKRSVLSEKATLKSGDAVMTRLKTLLGLFTTRSRQQVMFHATFMQACLRFIYGDEYEANEVRIKREYHIEELKQFALVCCPRRWGKSKATAMFVAAVLLSVPKIKVLLFSPGRRQSSELMKIVYDEIKHLSDNGYEYKTLKKNEEDFIIEVDGNQRSLKGLPASSDTTRGVTGDLIICEEIAYMDLKFMGEVVFPLMGVGNAALIAISTVSDQENFYSRMLEVKDASGMPLFNTVRFSLACDECMEAGLAGECEHKKHELPHWLSSGKFDILKSLYKQLGQEGLLQQETMGLSASRMERAFEANSIRDTFNVSLNPLYNIAKDSVDHVFMSVDPNAGGKRSDLAICSAIMRHGRFVVCGLESANPKGLEGALDLVVRHMRGLQSLLGPRVVFNLFVESNLGFVTQEIMKVALSGVAGSNVRVMNKKQYDTTMVQIGQGSSGVQTSHEVKEKMYQNVKDMLARSGLAFATRPVVVHNPRGCATYMERIKRIKKELRNQLVQYAIITATPNNDFMRTRITYSGKGSGGTKDDLAIALQLCAYWSYIAINRPDFATFTTRTATVL